MVVVGVRRERLGSGGGGGGGRQGGEESELESERRQAYSYIQG